MIALAAASGAMAMTAPMSAAFAADGGSVAEGVAAGSPGVLSGNTVQAPVHLPVNVCGNAVSVVGLLNPSMGNACANTSAGGSGASSTGTTAGQGNTGTAAGNEAGGATAQAGAQNSPGVLSGNNIQVPVHAPVNISNNSVSVLGAGNSTEGNSSTNGSSEEEIGEPVPEPPARAVPHPLPKPVTHPAPESRKPASLADTGADQAVPALAASAALLAGGVALYRRYRPGATR
ncbi:LAXTG-anchored chaplin ChpB [Streptomyces thermoalcalitolerans]|uniref:LAXTG-anchored chaplin ChpB n=1 Tax=Streptomyces thermoalcalitolerans TaxID=65605 RepID=A0ABP3ZCV6_9ACTN